MLLCNVKRFILSNRSIIDTAVLQIYYSALIFSPKNSRITSSFWDQTPRWIKNVALVQDEMQSLNRHSNSVRAVAFSIDGQRLTSSSEDSTVSLWDLLIEASRRILEGHSNRVFALPYSSEGQLLASASADGRVRLWDPLTGAVRRTCVGHSRFVIAVVISPNGQLLASVFADNTVRLWGSPTGASPCILKGHSQLVDAAVLSPDGRLLAAASGDSTVRLWDPSTGALYGIIRGQPCFVPAAVFSSDGTLLTSESDDSNFRLCILWTAAPRCIIVRHPAMVRAAIIAPNVQHFTFASDDDTVMLISLVTACLHGRIHKEFCIAVIAAATEELILRDGQFLASTPDDHTVKPRDLWTAASCSTFEGHSARLNRVVFPWDDRLLASASHDKSVSINNAKTKETTQIRQAEDVIQELSHSHEYWLILMRRLMVFLFITSCVFGFWLSPLSG